MGGHPGPFPRQVVFLLAAAVAAVSCENYGSPVFLPGDERFRRPEVSLVATPVPTPTPVFGCGLPRGSGNGRGCGKEGPSFQGEIEAAIDQVIHEHPDFFDLNDARPGGGDRDYRVLNVPQYVDEVVFNLRTMGFCALNDGEEIAIKNSNDFNDQYDIITGAGFILRGYMATCRPAWDAIPPYGDNS